MRKSHANGLFLSLLCNSEQSPESSLLKVPISCQRVVEPPLAHNGERNTICQTPLFVVMLLKQPQPILQPLSRCRNEFNPTILLQNPDRV